MKWPLIHFCISAVQCLFCLSCLVYLLRTHCSKPREHSKWCPFRFEILARYPKLVSRLRITSIACFLASSICQGIYFRNRMEDIESSNTDDILLTALLCWSVGQCFVYLKFLFRLIDAFSDSIYAIRESTICQTVSLLILFQTSWIIKCLAALQKLSISSDIAHYLDIYLIIAVAIPDGLLPFLVVYSFVSRLYMISRSQGDTRLCHFAMQICLLSIIPCISSFVFYISSTITTIRDDWEIAEDVYYFLFQYSTMISCLCIVLILDSARSLYDILCCCCVRTCMPTMKRHFLKREVWNRTDRSTMNSLGGQSNVTQGLAHGASDSVTLKSNPLLLTVDSGDSMELLFEQMVIEHN